MLKSRIPTLIASASKKADLIVEKTARDIEAGAKERSRVDTGTMKSGFEVRDATTKPQSVGRGASSGPRAVGGGMTALLRGAGDPGREVVNPVEHTIHNEFGTSKMPAQPMLVPAAEEARPGFIAAMKQVYR